MNFFRKFVTSFILLITGFSLGFATNLFLKIQPGSLLPQVTATQAEDPAQYKQALQIADQIIAKLSDDLENSNNQTPRTIVVTPAPAGVGTELTYINPNATFSGEDLFQDVNKYRREHGVPELKLHSELCQLSSRRLGEILENGKLDNHAGFEAYFESNSVQDMGLSAVAENLASGYNTAWETVMGWDSSPPHRKFLLSDGSYIWGCTSANMGFAVLVAGY